MGTTPGSTATMTSRHRGSTQAAVSHHDTILGGSGRCQESAQAALEAKAVNRLCVGNISFVPTAEGWLYLAVLIDLYSRRVVGWAMSGKIDQQLVLDGLNMALLQRRVEPRLIHHTDQGRQYSSAAYLAVLKHHGTITSMSGEPTVTTMQSLRVS